MAVKLNCFQSNFGFAYLCEGICINSNGIWVIFQIWNIIVLFNIRYFSINLHISNRCRWINPSLLSHHLRVYLWDMGTFWNTQCTHFTYFFFRLHNSVCLLNIHFLILLILTLSFHFFLMNMNTVRFPFKKYKIYLKVFKFIFTHF